MLKVVKQEIEMEEALKKKLEFICSFCNVSPIIQNGKIVGAVTHVFVNDPVRGYGIFAENMISEIQKLCISKYNLVS